VRYSFRAFGAPLLALVLLVSAGCSKTQQNGAALDDAFRAGISPDVQTIVSVKLDKVKASELYRRHEQLLDLPQLNSMAERAGLDPRRDVSNLCIAWDGKHLVLLAQGSFSTAQLEKKLLANGAQRVPYKNWALLTRGGDSVSFPGHGLAVASSTAAVEAELDLLAAHAGGIPEELQQRLAEVPSDAQIWEVSRGGLPFANFPMRADLDSALSNIAMVVSGTSFGLRLDAGSHLQSRITCKSPEGAQRVHDAFRGLIGFARLSTKDNELDLLRMWDAVSISKDQQVVRVQADLPVDLSDKLIDKISDLRGRAGALLHPN
jgi:hypothetical protein